MVLRGPGTTVLLSCPPQVLYRDGPQACEFQWHRKVGKPLSPASCALHAALHMSTCGWATNSQFYGWSALIMRLPFSPPPPLALPSPCSNTTSHCPSPCPAQRLFDQPVAAMLHELCTAAPLATVTSVEGARKSRWAPVPLSTLEMQKRGSQVGRWESDFPLLRMGPHVSQ